MAHCGFDLPPKFLTNAPKFLIKALDPSEALRTVLAAATDDPSADGPILALDRLQFYLDAAKRQQKRIGAIRALRHKRMRAARPRRDDGLFADVHFYVICWTMVCKLAESVRDRLNQNASRWNVPTFSRIGEVLRPYHSELKKRTDARDHLEHFDERLPGGKSAHKLRTPNDLLNMRNEFLTYGGNRLDIGPDSVRLLKEIVSRFQRALLHDSLEALQTTSPGDLSRLLGRAARRVRTARAERLSRSDASSKVKGGTT